MWGARKEIEENNDKVLMMDTIIQGVPKNDFQIAAEV